MIKDKTIKVSPKTWRELNRLKKKLNTHSADETIQKLMEDKKNGSN